MKSVSKNTKPVLRLCLVLCLVFVSGSAFAINAERSNLSPTSSFESIDSLGLSLRSNDKSTYQSVLQPLIKAQAQPSSSSNLRSKSEVMREVKRRYNGKVVKISLNERASTYSVRVLMPSGKVKNLSVSATK